MPSIAAGSAGCAGRECRRARVGSRGTVEAVRLARRVLHAPDATGCARFGAIPTREGADGALRAGNHCRRGSVRAGRAVDAVCGPRRALRPAGGAGVALRLAFQGLTRAWRAVVAARGPCFLRVRPRAAHGAAGLPLPRLKAARRAVGAVLRRALVLVAPGVAGLTRFRARTVRVSAGEAVDAVRLRRRWLRAATRALIAARLASGVLEGPRAAATALQRARRVRVAADGAVGAVDLAGARLRAAHVAVHAVRGAHAGRIPPCRAARALGRPAAVRVGAHIAQRAGELAAAREVVAVGAEGAGAARAREELPDGVLPCRIVQGAMVVVRMEAERAPEVHVRPVEVDVAGEARVQAVREPRQVAIHAVVRNVENLQVFHRRDGGWQRRRQVVRADVQRPQVRRPGERRGQLPTERVVAQLEDGQLLERAEVRDFSLEVVVREVEVLELRVVREARRNAAPETVPAQIEVDEAVEVTERRGKLAGQGVVVEVDVVEGRGVAHVLWQGAVEPVVAEHEHLQVRHAPNAVGDRADEAQAGQEEVPHARVAVDEQVLEGAFDLRVEVRQVELDHVLDAGHRLLAIEALPAIEEGAVRESREQGRIRVPRAALPLDKLGRQHHRPPGAWIGQRVVVKAHGLDVLRVANVVHVIACAEWAGNTPVLVRGRRPVPQGLPAGARRVERLEVALPRSAVVREVPAPAVFNVGAGYLLVPDAVAHVRLKHLLGLEVRRRLHLGVVRDPGRGPEHEKEEAREHPSR